MSHIAGDIPKVTGTKRKSDFAEKRSENPLTVDILYGKMAL